MYPTDPAHRRQLHQQLQLREALQGLAEFTLAAARPTGWLRVEILGAEPAVAQPAPDLSTVVPLQAHRAARS